MLLCVLVLLAGSMAYAGATGQLATLPGRIGTTILVPFQRAASAVSEGAAGIWNRFAAFGDTQKENIALRERVAELEGQLAELEQYQAENRQLKEFYNIQEENPEWGTLPAFVVGRDPLSQFYAFTIDQGSLAGVKEGDPVVASSGSLVGIVVEVGPGWARVKTILDPTTNAAARISRTRDSGIAGGNADAAPDGQCVMSGLTRDSNVAIGDLVVTTGLGEVYPAGLLVGTVADLTADPGGTGIRAVIQPTEDIATLSSVMVVTSFS